MSSWKGCCRRRRKGQARCGGGGRGSVGRQRVVEADRRHLRLALALAARGAGQTSPNPMVGAVVVRGGRVVGRGFHTRAGAPHAEAVALAQAGRRARGAILYVNLEPCCHFGRTPPCVDTLIGAGVRRVVACMRDPDPRVRGRGFRALRAAGVRVRVGVLLREAGVLNAEFVRRLAAARPFVTLKAGMSLDGRIATRSGESKWITSQRAGAAGRELRCAHDAVMVGVNTVLRDDPRLTAAPARREGAGTMLRPLPARVVLDGRLRTPPGARLLRAAGGQPIIVTLPGAPARRRRRLERAGALVLEVAGRDGRISVGGALRELGRRGISSVLIEGGSELLGSALDERLGDRLVVFVAARPTRGGGRIARGAVPGAPALRQR